MKNITLKEIANELGLSISTISKALNNSDEISQETRDKIKAFAKLYNYKPNVIAQNLRSKSTKTIGVILPEIAHHFFSKVIEGIENVTYELGYQVIISLSNELFHQEVLQLELLSNNKVDGIIMSLAKETQHMSNFQHLYDLLESELPVVMFDRIIEDFPCDKVIVDDFHGSKRAVNHLIENGAKTIGLITTADFVTVGNLRLQGYEKALHEANISYNEDLILKLEHQMYNDEGEELMEKQIHQFLKKNPKIDGIFAVNELYATKAMKCIRELNKQIPEDIKIIGFTNGILSRNVYPALSTVHQFGHLVGENAARKLFERINQNETPESYETIIIKTEIIERASSISKK